MNKKLAVIAVLSTVALVLGGLQSSMFYGTEYMSSREGYSFSISSSVEWWDCNWSYCKKIVIDHSKVLSDQTDFPVLLKRGSDAELAAYAQGDGDDIVFVNEYNSSQYKHEIEKYNGGTGELVAWVRVSSLSSSEDTILYMYYGNPNCDSQENITATWDSNYALVQHLNETSGTLFDSTSNSNDGVNNGAGSNSSSKIDGGYDFGGDANISVSDSSSLDITNSITLEGWVKDPPCFSKILKPMVEIVDKREEKLDVKTNEEFTVNRTIRSSKKSDVVFAAIHTKDVEINDIIIDNKSVYDHTYRTGEIDGVNEKRLENIIKELPEEIRELNIVAISGPFTLDLEKTVHIDAVKNNFGDGRISYIVLSEDNVYDFETTTHLKIKNLYNFLTKSCVDTTLINDCFLSFLNLPCLSSLPSFTKSSSLRFFAPFIISSMNLSNFLRFSSNITSSSIRFSSRGFSLSNILGSLISRSSISVTNNSIDNSCLNSFASKKERSTTAEQNIVEIVDKKDEKINVTSREEFTVERNISANKKTDVIFAAIHTPNVQIKDILIDNKSVYDHTYRRGEIDGVNEKRLENIIKELPEEIRELNIVAISGPFTLDLEKTVHIDAVKNNFGDGRISYIVLSEDNVYDYETTTHVNEKSSYLVKHNLVKYISKFPHLKNINNYFKKHIFDGDEDFLKLKSESIVQEDDKFFIKNIKVRPYVQNKDVFKVNTTIPEIRYPNQVFLKSQMDTKISDVDDYTLLDTNGNDLYDTVEWMVNSKIEKTFEAKVDLGKVKYKSIVADHINNYDGTHTAVITSGAQNYYDKDLNEYRPINNNIKESNSQLFEYENTENIFESYFSRSGIIRFKKNNSDINFYLIDQDFSKINTNYEVKVDNSTINYENFYDDVDVRYSVYSGSLLEEFLIHKPMNISSISERYETKNVVNYEIMDDGSIEFYNQGDEYVFRIPAPLMWEENNRSEECDGLHYEITKKDGEFFITKVIDEKGKRWLEDKKRDYPVVIDASIEPYGETSDGYVVNQDSSWSDCQSDTDGDSSSDSDQRIGGAISAAQGPFSYTISRSFFEFDTSSLPDSCTITGAYIDIYGYSKSDSKVSIQEGTQGGSLTTADYDAFTGSKLTNSDVSWMTGRDNRFTLNAYTSIDKRGSSYYCLREGEYDYDNDQPSSTYENGCYYSDYMGASEKPRMNVNYTSNSAPTASYQSGADSNQYAGKSYSFITRHADADGADDIAYAYAELSGTDPDGGVDSERIRFRCDPNSGASPTVTVVAGSSYVIGTPTASRSNEGLETGWYITWTYEPDWDWPKDDEGDIDYFANTVDDQAAESGWASHNANADFENDIEVASLGLLIDGNYEYGGTDGQIDDGDYFAGGQAVTAAGTVEYQGSDETFDSSYDPNAVTEVQLFYDTDGDGTPNDLGSSYKNNSISSGDFSIPAYTPTDDGTLETNADWDVAIQNVPSGGSDVTAAGIEVDCTRDDENPTGSIDAISDDTCPDTIEGDVSDGSGAGVESCDIKIYDSTDGDYWTGSGWGSETWLDCSGTSSWSYTGIDPSDWDGGGHSITITLRVYDNVSNVDSNADTESFTTCTLNSAPVNDGCQCDNPDDTDNLYARMRKYEFTVNTHDDDGYNDIDYIELRSQAADDGYDQWIVKYDEDIDEFTEESGGSYIELDTSGSSASTSGSASGGRGDLDVTFKLYIEWGHPDLTDRDLQVYTVDDEPESDTDTYNVNYDYETRLDITSLSVDDSSGTADRGCLDGSYTLTGTVVYYGTSTNPDDATLDVVDVWASQDQYGTNTGPWSDTGLSSGQFSITGYYDNAVGQDTITVKVVADGAGSGGTDQCHDTHTDTCIADRVQVQSYSVSDSRDDINDNVNIDVTLDYDHDNSDVTDGTVTINGNAAAHQGSGVWRITDSESTVTANTYDTVAVSGNTHGLDCVDQNGQSTTVIWDRVDITNIVITSEIYDSGTRYWDKDTSLTLTYTAEYDYDNTAFSGDITVGYSGDTTAWGNTGADLAIDVDDSVADSVITRDDVTVGAIASDSNYDLTEFVVTATTPEVGWDREAPTTPTDAACHDDQYSGNAEWDDDTNIYFTWTNANDGGGSGIDTHYAEIGSATPVEDAGNDQEDTDTGTANQENTYYVRAKDNVGNYGSCDSDTIKIDTEDPDTSIDAIADEAEPTSITGDATDLTYGNVSGVNLTIKNETDDTYWTGSSWGAKTWLSATPDDGTFDSDNEAWTYDNQDGIWANSKWYVITANTSDYAGNDDPTPAVEHWNISAGNTAPSISSFETIIEGNNDYDLDHDNISINWTVTDSESDNLWLLFNYSTGGTPGIPTNTSYQGKIAVTSGGNPGYNENNYNLSWTDASGWIDTTDNVNITFRVYDGSLYSGFWNDTNNITGIDGTSPTTLSIYDISEDTQPGYLHYNGSSGIYYSNAGTGNREFTVYVEASDATSGLFKATYPATVSPGGDDESEAGGDYEYEYTYTATGDGETFDDTATVTVYDIAGNSATVNFDVLLDDTAPTFDSFTLYADTDSDGGDDINPDTGWYDDLTIQGDFSGCSDAKSGIANYSIQTDSDGLGTPDADGTDVGCTAGGEGTNKNINYNISDNVGNTDAGDTTVDVNIDTTPPSSTDAMTNYAESGDTDEIYGGTTNNKFYFSNSFDSSATANFTGNFTDSNKWKADYSSFGGDDPAEDTTEDYTGEYTINNTDTAGTITFYAYDQAGNSDSDAIDCIEDDTNPSISISTEQENSIYLYKDYGTTQQGYYGSQMSSTKNYWINGTASDTTGIDNIIDDKSFGDNPSNTGTNESWIFMYQIDAADNGDTNITFTATDYVGNTGTTWYQFYEDNENPLSGLTDIPASLPDLDNINGTATDNVSVDWVKIYIKNTTAEPDTYWTGSTWTDSITWVGATANDSNYDSNSEGWNVDTTGITWTDGSSYEVNATSYDIVNNTNYSTDSFTISQEDIPTASYYTGIKNTYGGKQTNDWKTNHTDADGQSDVNDCYLRVGEEGGNNFTLAYNPDNNSYWIKDGNSYVISIDNVYNTSITNGYTVVWNFTVDWDFPFDDSDFDVAAYTDDEDGDNSGYQWDEGGTTTHENDLIIYSITEYTLNNSDYSEDGDTTLTEDEWFRGGVQVKASGVVTYEGTTNVYPPTTAVDVHFWADGSDQGESNDDDDLDASGGFETTYYTTTDASGTDSDYDFNVSLSEFTTGAGQGTGQTTTLRNSSRDNEEPNTPTLIDVPDGTTGPNSIWGTSTDSTSIAGNHGGESTGCQITIKDDDNNNYWTGSSWGALTWLDCSANDTTWDGTSEDWNNDTSGVNWGEGINYTISAKAIDHVGNTDSTLITDSFRMAYTPTVITNESTGVEETNATLRGYLKDDGLESCTLGFRYGTSSGSYSENLSIAGTHNTGTEYSNNNESLTSGDLYYYQAWANNTGGFANGTEKTFFTKPEDPDSITVTGTTATTADLSIDKADTGSGSTNYTYIRYQTGSYPSNRGEGTFGINSTSTTPQLTGLSSGTHYYASAWAWAEEGSKGQYSDSYITFQFNTSNTPTVITNQTTGIEETNATLRGFLSDNGSADTTCGFRFGTTSGSYSENLSKGVIANHTEFSNNNESLTPGQIYYFQAWANNSAGFSTGSELKFLTKPNAPSSFIATTVNSSSIDLSWTKGDGANNTYIERNTSSSWTRGQGTEIYNSTGTTYTDTGLSEGTNYYYQAWSYSEWSNLHHYSDNYDTTNNKTNNKPEINLITPSPNGTTEVQTTPQCSIWANDTDGDNLNIYWYENTTGDYILRNTNDSESANSTVSYIYSEFSSTSATYYWKVAVNDTMDNVTSWFYFTTTSGNNPPSQSGEAPVNTTTNICPIPSLHVICTDPDGDTMNATWWSNSSDSWVQFASNSSIANNTNITQTNSNFSNPGKTYYWSVNLTDDNGGWYNKTYHFTTNYKPTQTGEAPSDTKTDVCPIPSLHVVCSDSDSDTMTAYWYSNSSYTWQKFATNNSVSTGSNITQTNSNFSQSGKKYWWSVNLTDGCNWTNTTYSFTTNYAPTKTGETPSNGSTGIDLTPSLHVICSDSDSDTMTVYWYSNSSETWHKFATNNSVTSGTNITQTNSNFSNYNITYYWSVNITDGCTWTNTTYHFTTKINKEQPTVITNASTGVEETNATINGYLQSNGNASTTVGFWYDTTSGGTTNNVTVGTVSQGSEFSYNATGLTPGKLYYFTAWAYNSEGFVNGSELTFLTKPNATVSGSFHAQTNSSSIIYLTWTKGTGANNTYIERNTVSSWSRGSGIEIYNKSGTSCEDSGLTAGTTYYYQAWSFVNWTYNPTLHQWSDNNESTSNTTNNVPVLSNENPANESTGISLNPTLQIQVNHSDSYQMNITWYWGIDSGCPNLIGSNNSVSNGTYYMNNDNNFSSNSQTYYWKVTVNDGHGEWTNETYHFTTIGANKGIVSKGQNAYSLEMNPDGTTLYGYINSNSVSTDIDTSWHYVTMTYDGSTIRLFKDGVEVDNTSLLDSINTNNDDLLLGEYMTGTLDELRVSNTKRSAAWINTTYENTNSPTTFASFGSQKGILSTMSYRKKIWINSSMIDSDISNYPVLVSTTDTDLKDNAHSSGYDIVFTNSTVSWTTGSFTDILPHEIEKWDSSTGELVCWVNVDSISSTSNTSIYMYYGSTCTDNKENITGVWDSNYALVHHLNESSDPYRDSTSNNNDGSESGGINQGATGKIDGCSDFDGNNDYINISDDSSLNFGLSDFSFSVWFKIDSSPSSTNQILCKRTSGGGNYEVQVESTGKIRAYIEEDTTNSTSIDSTTTVKPNVWYLASVVRNSGTMYLYINGTQENSSVADYNVDNSKSLQIGRDVVLESEYFNGSIDEARISNTVRNSNWINTTFNNIHYQNNFLIFGSEEIPNVAPIQSNPVPADGATGQSLNPTLSIQINDTNKDSMDVTFRTNASGSWSNIDSNNTVKNGTYSQIPSNMNSYNKRYWWSANVTDGSLWCNHSYSFTTSSLPQVSDENPSDGSSGVSLQPTCNVTVSDSNGGTVDVYFYENTSGWTQRQFNNSVDVTNPTNVVWDNYSNADTPSTKYWWSVNISDGTGWTNTTYSFTTAVASPFLYINSNGRYQFISDFIPGATSKDKEYVHYLDITDKVDVDKSGKIKLKITEELEEITYLDKVYLLVDDNIVIKPDITNDVIRNLITDSDNRYLVMNIGDQYEIEFLLPQIFSKIEFVSEGFYIKY